ncbi:GNAT family N-acetyltransferase [Alicyclobacillus curvatus]|nr:GNAT family N-acetyltransferase [Alicyclobacillus curvatus]
METPSRIRCEDITEELAQKYEEKGYQLVFQEYVMEHNLETVPELVTSQPFVFRSWSTELEGEFYALYYQCFKERPGFPQWSMDEWIDRVSSDTNFRPDLSYIVSLDNKNMGFITADNDAEDPEFDTHAYIIQIGVMPEWRRKGIASILTTKYLAACRGEGKKGVILHVNRNNPGAIKLYEGLGFKTVRTRGTFEK